MTDFLYYFGSVDLFGFLFPNLLLAVIFIFVAVWIFVFVMVYHTKRQRLQVEKMMKRTKESIPKPTDIKSRAVDREKKKKEERKALIEEKKKLTKELMILDKERHKKSKLNKSVQETIAYLADFKDGVFEIAREKEKQIYSICFVFEDINYSTLKVDDAKNVFIRYRDLINLLPADADVSLGINNTKINIEQYRKEIKIPYREDGYNLYRDEMNTMYDEVLCSGNQRLKKERYLIIAIAFENAAEAFSNFARLEGEILQAFKRLGTKARRLSTMERHEKLHDIFRPDEKGEFNKSGSLDFEQLSKWRISMKDYICPDGFEFKPNYFMMGEKYAQTLFILDFPSTMSDMFITRLTDVSFDILTTITIKPMYMADGVKLINKSILGMESDRQKQEKENIKAGYSPDMINHSLKDALTDAYAFRDDVQQNNQKVFFLSLIIMHTADSLVQLEVQKKTLQGIATQFLLQLRPLTNQQERGLKQSLPLGHNILDISTTTTSDSTSIFIPFISQELNSEHGFYYGINATSKNPIFFNRLQLLNGNGFILGASGGGKSFAAKREIINILLNTNDDVIVIDPDGEYVPFLKALKGEHIIISATSPHYINPLDLDKDYLAEKGDPIIAKQEFIASILETAIGDSYMGGLSPKQKSVIDRCVRKAYEPLVENDFDSDFTPTFKDLYQIFLEDESRSTGRDLAEAFDRFANGSLSVFSHYTNVDIQNRFAIYDISELGKQLNAMGSLIMLDAVWQRVLKNRRFGKRTWVYVDEFTVLLRIESSKTFFLDVFKRIRKMGGCATGITQNVTSLFRDADAMEMLANAEFVYLLSQAATDRLQLADILEISETEIEYVTDADKGCGLLKAGRYIIPFKDKFPKGTKLYEAMTTDPEERKIIDGLVKEPVKND